MESLYLGHELKEDAYEYALGMMGYPDITKLDSFGDKQMCHNLARAYIAGATQSRYVSSLNEKIKNMEHGLKMLCKNENRDHMMSIASATLSGEIKTNNIDVVKLLEEFFHEIRPHINGHKTATDKFFIALTQLKQDNSR